MKVDGGGSVMWQRSNQCDNQVTPSIKTQNPHAGVEQSHGQPKKSQKSVTSVMEGFLHYKRCNHRNKSTIAARHLNFLAIDTCNRNESQINLDS